VQPPEETPLSEIRLGLVTKQWADGHQIFAHYEPSLDSTNTLAKAKAFDASMQTPSLALFLTDHQTAGRGRGQNIWIDDSPGSSLLSSWSFLLPAKPQPTTSCLVGLAVYRALATTWSFLPWSLKAPNDIYLGEKKVAGILLESVAQGERVRLIVGLGINVFSSPENFGIAGSILQFLPPGVPLLGEDWLAFLDRLLFEISGALSNCAEPLSPSEQMSLVQILNQNPLLKTKYLSIDPNGTLHFEDGTKTNWWEL
jgi:BirA family biotin operon repressor/biotin-[acetyl-CoA-carboxylase] ligase